MNASLPMYDWMELRQQHEEYWTAIHHALERRGIDSPAELDEGFGLEYWSNPSLVFSQTCGMPYRKYLHNRVGLVGTPNYAVDGCPPGYYCSYFVVRKEKRGLDLSKLMDSVFAYNEKDSQSGYAAAWNHLKPQGLWFRSCIQTGSHVESAARVAAGKADIAAIDAVTWRFIDRYEDFSEELTILEKTTPTPGLPYITSVGINSELVHEALLAAVDELSSDVLRALGIQDIVRISSAAYCSVPLPPSN